MKMPKLDNLGAREKALLWVACLALVGMLLSFLSLPFVRGVQDKRAEGMVKLKELEESRTLVNAKEGVLKEFMKVESMLGESLSDAESISEIKENIEDMAGSVGLRIDPPSHKDPVTREDEPWREYVIELTKCEGSMEQLLALVDMLESAPVVYRVEKMNVTPAKSGNGVTASMVISRIMLPPQEDTVEEEESQVEG